jgi:hypothetical protein
MLFPQRVTDMPVKVTIKKPYEYLPVSKEVIHICCSRSILELAEMLVQLSDNPIFPSVIEFEHVLRTTGSAEMTRSWLLGEIVISQMNLSARAKAQAEDPPTGSA